MPAIDTQKLMNQFWSAIDSSQNVYALLDAARDDQIYATIRRLPTSKCRCLYGERWAEDLAEVAPYLVHLQPESNVTHSLITQGWGKSWGIFLVSPAAMDVVQAHCRRLLAVQDETGTPLYFRYYDPRVLRAYLPTCTEGQLQAILGASIVRYWVESADGSKLVEYPPKEGNPRAIA